MHSLQTPDGKDDRLHSFALVKDDTSTGLLAGPNRTKRTLKVVFLFCFILGVGAAVLAITTLPVKDTNPNKNPTSAVKCIDPATFQVGNSSSNSSSNSSTTSSSTAIPDGSPVCATTKATAPYTVLDLLAGQATPTSNSVGNVIVVGASYYGTTGATYVGNALNALITTVKPPCAILNAVSSSGLQQVLANTLVPIDSDVSLFISACGGAAFVLGSAGCVSVAMHPPQCVGRTYIRGGVSVGTQTSASAAFMLDIVPNGDCDSVLGASYGLGASVSVVTGFGATASSKNPDHSGPHSVSVMIPMANVGIGLGASGTITATTSYTCPDGQPTGLTTLVNTVRAFQASPPRAPAPYWDYTGQVAPFCNSAYSMGTRPFQTWGSFPIGKPRVMSIYNAYDCNSVLLVTKNGLKGYETWGTTPSTVYSLVTCAANCVSWNINYGAGPGKATQPLSSTLRAAYAQCNCDTVLGQWINWINSVPAATAIDLSAPVITSQTCKGTPTPDQTCGMAPNYYSCPSGTCCSQYGWCGSSPAHCNGNSLCLISGATVAPAPSTLCTAGKLTPDQTCGKAPAYYSCAAGACCSENGWCGTTTDYCNAKSLCR